ncbi:MAG: response regulator [Desulfobacterales bacterium]|nr:response regulator [Desulfobacterales bacterium]
MKSLQMKVTFWAGSCLLVMAAAIITYSSITMMHTAENLRKEKIEDARNYGTAVAKQYANHIKAEFELALDTARTLARVLSGKKDANIELEVSRDEINGILKTVLTRNPVFFGVYTCWETNAFDLMDRGYKNWEGHDGTGRFIPYWKREENGEIRLVPLADYEKEGPGDYYLLPRKTKTECMIEPRISDASAAGGAPLITSLVAPIITGDAFHGIVGVDLRLDIFQRLVEKVEHLYEGTGQIFVISNSGIICSATGKPEMAGKHLKDADTENSEKKLIHIREGREFIHMTEKHLEVLMPLKPGYTETPWAVRILIPSEKITAAADQQVQQAIRKMWKMIGMCILIAAVALSFLWGGTRSVLKPIRHITEEIRVIASGNFDRSIHSERNDEIGQLASDAESMRLAIKDLTEEMKTKNDALMQMDKLKDEFLANTSHELRTPLNGIVGIADSLADGSLGPLTGEQRHNLSLIVSSGRRLTSLVNDILDFSKLKHSDIQLLTGPLDMRSITDLVLMLSQTFVGTRDIQLVNQIETDLPAAMADENRVQQILHNLVGNALKFTETGTVSVSAGIREEYLAVTVSDTGIGISKESLDRIFRSFEQADGSTAREYGGTGLGLAVTRDLVELHGGQIWAESEPGKGSHFTFTLPVSGDRAEPVRTDGILAKDIHVAGISADPGEIGQTGEPDITDIPPERLCDGAVCRILAVDDEPVNLQVLKNQLTSEHYSVTLASDGREALNAVESGREFDLILLDVMMPGISGYEVCRRLRELYNPDELPVVMLTAKDRVGDLVEGFDAGANDYLTKPFVKEELIARVESHISMKNLAAQVRDLVNNLEHKVEERTLQLQESLENLRMTQDHLVQSEKMAALGGLVAGVAHEINTPVGLGVTEASFMKQKTDEFSERYGSGNLKRSDFEKYIKNATECTASILTNLERAAELIVSFKQVAVDQTGDVKRRFALKPYISEILLSLRSKYKKTSHTITVNCPEDAEIDSYPGAFSQIVTNFVTNSLLHGFEGIEKGEIRFDVTTEGDELLFRYSDNGRGMNEESLGRIFDPFFTTKRTRGGTGLGMHIVFNLVTRTLGGQIECSSAPGEGTSFLIRMKAEDQDSESMKLEI